VLVVPSVIPLRPVIGVIDDDASVLKALSRLLLAAGYGVVPFRSTEEFLVTRQQWRLDCLVLDVHFQGMNGLDLEAYLVDAGVRFPIVFITAHDEPSLRDRIVASGQAYLRKPLDEVALLDAIQRLLPESVRRAEPGR
jgi:FixJ family two-component response regulator